MYGLDEDIFEDQIGPDNLSLFYSLKYEGQMNNLVKKTVQKLGF